MARVLVVDDDNSQCMSLGFSFNSRGHTVEMATDGRNAIDTGVRFRPDVLVTDWMLKGPLDGIRISEVLRAVRPEIHTILVTGYPSQDLREAALKARLFGFFQKPLDLERLHAGIEKAGETEAQPANHSVGLLEFDAESTITHANAKARKMLGLPEELSVEDRLVEFLSYRSLAAINSVESKWTQLSLLDSSSAKFYGYVKDRNAATRLLVLVEKQESRDDPVVRELTATEEDTGGTPAISDTFLLVDEDKLQRRLASTQLHSMGCRFHSAESHDRALQILEADPDVKIMLLDYGTSDDGVADFVGRVRKIRGGITIVGTSTAFRKRQFEQMGVRRFLLKPVMATALTQVLEG